VKRERNTEPKLKKETQTPLKKAPIVQGFPEMTLATGGGIIIIGEHIAKMWEASRKAGK
jgi:hypothetical protein